jgi:hypothetical protein
VFCLLPAVSLCQPCHTCLCNLSHAVSYACLSVVSCLTCLCELFSVSYSCQLSQQLSYEFTCLLCAQNCLLSNLDGLGLEGGQGYFPVTCLALPRHPQLKSQSLVGPDCRLRQSAPAPSRGRVGTPPPWLIKGRPCPAASPPLGTTCIGWSGWSDSPICQHQSPPPFFFTQCLCW